MTTDGALRAARAGAAAFPGSAVLQNNLAVLLELTGDMAGAEAALRAALAEDPSLPQVSKNLADILYRNGRYDEANEAYERAAKLAPELGDDLYFKLGNIAYKRRDHGAARAGWSRATDAQSRARAGPGQPRHAGSGPVTPADDAAFAELVAADRPGRGLVLEAYKDKCVRRRIAVRMRACGVHTYADYRALLERSPEEYERLGTRSPSTSPASTGTPTPGRCSGATWCPAWWTRGRRDFRPGARAALRARSRTPWPCWWSSTSSSGAGGRARPARIEATDIDRACLDRARPASIGGDALAELPPELAGRYFQPAGARPRWWTRARRWWRSRELDLSRQRPLRAGTTTSSSAATW